MNHLLFYNKYNQKKTIMKKNIFILAMVAMFVSANVMAETPAKKETKTECCNKGEKKD